MGRFSFSNYQELKTLAIIGVKAFCLCACAFGLVLWITFVLYFGELSVTFRYSFLAGVVCGLSAAALCVIDRVAFKKKILLYQGMNAQIGTLGVHRIILEENAVNTTTLRIRSGGLFLTDSAIIFIPIRFALGRQCLVLPLDQIQEVRKLAINPLKFLKAGLWSRLLLRTMAGRNYEFALWQTDEWILKIHQQLSLLCGDATGGEVYEPCPP